MTAKTKLLPPGPKGNPIIGCAEKLRQDPLGFLTQCQNDFGDVVQFSIATFPVLFINDPDLIHQVLVTESSNFSKDAAIKNNRVFFGNGLLSSEGEYWKRQRKLSSPAFSLKRLEQYSLIMVEQVLKKLGQWHDSQTVDIQHEMMGLALHIAAKTLFDAELSEDNIELEEALTAAQKHLADRMNGALLLALPEWVPFPTNIYLLKAIKTVDNVIYKLIKERRGKSVGRTDLLSTLINVKDEENDSGMTDQQIRDEVFTLFFAGHETTALTLTWTLYLLAQNSDIEKLLFAEVKDVLGQRSPKFSDYSALSFAEKVIKESMRVRPPVWAMGREAIADCDISGYHVKKGTAILMSQWVMHHDKRYYDEPNLFKPDRWTKEFEESLPKFAYFPFGGGPRVCIGNNFAMLEAVLLLAAMVQRFRFSMVANQQVELKAAVTLRPAHGIKMMLHKR